MPNFDPVAYKQKQKENWTHNAPSYHRNFVAQQAGPFQAPEKMVQLADVQLGQHVLDVATGTGSVLIELAPAVGETGHVLGIDLAPGMLAVAKERMAEFPWVIVQEQDAEALQFVEQFDAVTCQFGMMFFPHTQTALNGMKRALKPQGTLALAVHGKTQNLPFFTCIMNIAKNHFPQLAEQQEPGPMRFSKPNKLKEAVAAAGFNNIEQHSQIYDIEFANMDLYLEVFFGSSPKAFVELVRNLDDAASTEFLAEIANLIGPYQTPSSIVFPWEVLFLTAQKPKQ